MKTKTFVVLFIILVALAGAVSLLIYSRDTRSPSGEMGTVLLDQLPANEIASIIIETPNAAVSLKKGSDSWIVEERFGYPADFSKISDLVRTLKEVKVGRKFDASEKVLKRLSMKSPGDTGVSKEETGTRIRMADSGGKTLLEIVLGKTRTRDPQKGPPDGQYVMLSKAPEIYLIDKILSSFETGPSEWLEKQPVEIDAAKIRKITCLGPDATTVRYAFERPGKGKDFELIEPSTDRNVKKSSLSRLSNALSSLKIEDVETSVAPHKPFGKDASARLDYVLFDGRVYHVTIGKACSVTIPCQIRLAVDYEPPGPVTRGADQAAKTDEKAHAGTQSGEAIAADASKENGRLSPWIFTIPEWQYKAFFPQVDELLEKKAEKKAAQSTPVN